MAHPSHHIPAGAAIREEPSMVITAAVVRVNLNSIAWYFKRTPALDIPSDLFNKLPMDLREICKNYTN